MKADMGSHLTEEQLHGAADGSLASEEAHSAFRHLDACPECRADVGRIRALLAGAGSLPRAIAPPDDLWPAIQARVQPAGSSAHPGPTGPGEDVATRTRALPIPRPRREYAVMAAAALFLVVVTSGITMRVVRDDRPFASTPVGGSNDSIDGVTRFRAVSAEYDRLDRDLARRLDEHREKLQPETIEKVERNLLIIDRAIGEIRQALAEDPNNEALEALLKASYGQKSALLQQVSQS